MSELELNAEEAFVGTVEPEGADRLDTATMSRNARQKTLFCPPPVAVHDDGNVLRDTVGIRNRTRRTVKNSH